MMHKHQQTVRLTIDFPANQHTYIKMLAAKEGVSLRQFVIEHLPNLKKGKEKRNLKTQAMKSSMIYFGNFLLKKLQYSRDYLKIEKNLMIKK